MTVAQMEEIRNAIIILVVVILGGFGTFATAFFAYVRHRFEIRAKESEAQLKAFEQKINQRKAEVDVDIERDRILPQLIQSINSFVASNIQQTQVFATLIQARTEQDARSAGELHSHTLAVTSVTEGLEELRSEFEDIRQQVEALVVSVQHNTNASSASENASKRTLQLMETFGSKLDSVTQTVKHDSRPIPGLDLVKNTGEIPKVNE